eukprot:7582458-Heterocapsa_arctica.AAC.1
MSLLRTGWCLDTIVSSAPRSFAPACCQPGTLAMLRSGSRNPPMHSAFSRSRRCFLVSVSVGSTRSSKETATRWTSRRAGLEAPVRTPGRGHRT